MKELNAEIKELLARLAAYMVTDGKYVRGSRSRCADYCRVSHGTITSWVSGKRKPTKNNIRNIEEILSGAVAFSAKKTGPILGSKRPKKVAVVEPVAVVDSVVEPVAV
jgi:hypothetical protein